MKLFERFIRQKHPRYLFLILLACVALTTFFSGSAIAAPIQPGTARGGYNLEGPYWQRSQVRYEFDLSGPIDKAEIDTVSLDNMILSLNNRMLGFISPEAAAQAGVKVGDGAVGGFGRLIAGMTANPPVRTATYLADVGQSLGLVKTAYAQQGTGFRALEPVLPLWKAFRNIAYLGFVIIFVVVGFMIMFQARINPQTVISIQAALPQIIVTLLLVTFSYAIAAFMVDLIYLLILLIITTFKTFGILSTTADAERIIFNQNLFVTGLSEMFGLSTDSPVNAAASAVGEIAYSVFEGIGGAIVGVIGESLGYAVFAIVILIAIFKLFFQLLLAYIGIVFGTIFAPITLLFNALPGSQSFMTWLKGILANALVFPVTALMFLVAGALLSSENFGVAPGIGFKSLDPSKTSLPFVGGGIPTSAIQALIGIGFLTLMPKVLELVQKMMGIEGGIAGMAGAAMALPMSTAGGVTNYLFGASQAEQYTRQGLLRRAPIPGTTRIPFLTKGVTLPSWLDISKYMKK